MLKPEYKPPPLNGAHQAFNLLAGVIMPAISITLEATTHFCARRYFDPIPSVWHLMLVIFVPVAQLHIWFTINRGNPQRLVLAGWLNALSLGVAIFYSFVFIPFLPLAMIPIVGLLSLPPLAPVFSLVAAIIQRHQLKQIAARAPQNFFIMRKVGLLTGLVLMAACIGLLELPASITRYSLKLATSQSPETRAKGIHFLREFGSREYLLRASYGHNGGPIDFVGYIFGLQNPINTTHARQIYYRVTGEAVDPSLPLRRSGGRLLPQDEFDFDYGEGGVKVGGKVKGLSLSKSRIYTNADADGGIAYTEWTLVFSNASASSREARAEVQLPPGAVVSRLTRWVDGEELEADFASRGKVTNAYQQLRGPVLVTTSGRDRILLKCFPVPAESEIKIRIGITIPLLLEDLNNAKLLLPHFIDRNFRIPDELTHNVRIESKTSISSASSAFMTTEFTADMFAHRGRIPEREMSNPRTTILIARRNVPIWSKDPFQSGNFMIQQAFEARRPQHLYRIVLVVDTSAATPDMTDELIAALGSIPAGFDFKLVLADADGNSHNVTASGVKEASAFLRNATFQGGADNVPALIKAWELATQKPGNNAIVWVHGPQLLQLQPAKELRWRWEVGPYGPSLYSLQTRSGSDQILQTLDGIDEVKSVARTNEFGVDFRRLLQRLTGQMTTLEWVRTSKKIESLPYPNEGIQTSDQLARLWANDEVTRILAPGDELLNEAATMLAVRYHLVTPVTGAVVAEKEH
ncbi:MAG TPA: VIT domain-containing protein [Pyrinomonadaceae bacterium]|nr:VIT domain-containing protein [Pyrinomonadaceae bacterium]